MNPDYRVNMNTLMTHRSTKVLYAIHAGTIPNITHFYILNYIQSLYAPCLVDNMDFTALLPCPRLHCSVKLGP